MRRLLGAGLCGGAEIVKLNGAPGWPLPFASAACCESTNTCLFHGIPQTHASTCIHASIYAYTYLCTHTCRQLHACKYLHVYMHVPMHTCMTCRLLQLHSIRPGQERALRYRRGGLQHRQGGRSAAGQQGPAPGICATERTTCVHSRSSQHVPCGEALRLPARVSAQARTSQLPASSVQRSQSLASYAPPRRRGQAKGAGLHP